MTKKPDEDRILWNGERKPPRSDLWWGVLFWCVACALAIAVGTCWAMSGGPAQ